ncbi:MAG: T9SS type A sorting domain-containing protein [Bacteroidales bacterium]|nr:T9SS type A sorting domain-containing protein [Bacteroidales bacterium]
MKLKAIHLASILFIVPLITLGQQDTIEKVIITFEDAPASLSIEKASLKYDKDFAFGMHIDDGKKDIYTHAYPFLTGGVVEGQTYPGLTYTDGCGNDINFRMSSSIYSFANNNVDAHDPDGNYAEINVTWPELEEMYQEGWSIFNHGLTSGVGINKPYSIGRNHSYIKRKTQDAYPVGVDSRIFINPNGDVSFTDPAHAQGYDIAFTESYQFGNPALNVDQHNDWDSLTMYRRNTYESVDIPNLVDILAQMSAGGEAHWRSVFTHAVNDNSNGYSFSTFKSHMNYIENTYGKNGNDNIWMTTEEEVLEYLILRDTIDLNVNQNGNFAVITFDGDMPTDLRFYELTLTVEADTTINSIDIVGGTNHSYTGTGTKEMLINLRWDGAEIIPPEVHAENYVSIAESTQTTNDALIAMDYVEMVPPGPEKNAFRDRLCDIPNVSLPDGYCNCEADAGNDTTACIGNCVELSANEGTDYEWNTGDTTQSIIVCPNDTTEYWVRVYNELGCNNTDTVTVNTAPSPNAVTSPDTTVCPGVTFTIEATGGGDYLWNTGDTTANINVTPVQDTFYYVTVTNQYGCTANDTTFVDLKPAPVANAYPDTSICPSDSVTLHAEGGVDFLWNTGDTTSQITVSPQTDTTYFAEVFNAEGCSDIDSVEVAMHPLPEANAWPDTAICLYDSVTLYAQGGSSFTWNTGETGNEITVAPLQDTYYSVEAFNEFGCSDLDSVEVVVNPLPEALAYPDTTICQGESVTLHASGGSAYLWSNGDTSSQITVSPEQTTTYSVSVFNEYGCIDEDSAEVVVNPLPEAQAWPDTIIYQNQSVTLHAGGGEFYLWSNGENGSAITVSPMHSTEYSVEVIDENGCVDYDTVNVYVKSPPEQNTIDQVIIAFDSEPTEYTIEKTPLMYDKDFAFTLHLDAAQKEVYTHALPFLNGGEVGGQTYPGLEYTDGAGNDLNFKMGTTIFSFSENDEDVHDPEGAFSEIYATWPELEELYQEGWGLYNFGLKQTTTIDHHYSIGRDHSYIKLNTQNATETGVDPHVFVNPQGDDSFTGPAFELGYPVVYDESFQYGNPHAVVENNHDWDTLQMYRRNVYESVNMKNIVDILSVVSDDSTHPWLTAYTQSITNPNTGYSFETFKTHMNNIADTYGKDGDDRIWMTSAEEVLDYVTIRDTIDYTVTIDGQLMYIEFFDTHVPDDLRHYALTMNISADAEIGAIDIVGGSNHTYTGIGTNQVLLNLRWDGQEVIPPEENAEIYVSKAEDTQSTLDALIAMDYVDMVPPGETHDDFRDRLCNIPGVEMPEGYCECEADAGADTTICAGTCATLTASEGVTYEWSTGDSTQSIEVCPMDTTEYWVTVYNDQGCHDTDTVQVNVVPTPTAVVSNDTTICAADSITLEASGGIAFEWSTGDTTATITVAPVVDTFYTVTVFNQYDCFDTDTVSVFTNPLPDLQAGPDTTICQYDSIFLIATGGDSYQWSTGETNDTIQVAPLKDTLYTVEAFNEFGCSTTDTVEVLVNPIPNAQAWPDTAICRNDSVTLYASGGTEFLWSTGETTDSITVAPQSNTFYTVEVFNEFGCSDIDTVDVEVYPLPTAEAWPDTTVCPGTTVTLHATGGVAYEWSTGDTINEIEVTPTTDTLFIVTVYNEPGCTDSDTVEINMHPVPGVEAFPDTTICRYDSIFLFASGAESYQWSTGDTTAMIEVGPLQDTMYYVEGFNEHGCSATDSVEVLVDPIPDADAYPDTAICRYDSVTLYASGGESYLWNTGDTTESITVAPEFNTFYTLEAFNEFGCSDIDTVNVEVYPLPTAEAWPDTTICPGDTITLHAMGGYEYDWSTGDTINEIEVSPVTDTIFTVTVYNLQGCSDTDTVEVNMHPVPEAVVWPDRVICEMDTTELYAGGGVDYLWNTGDTTSSIDVSPVQDTFYYAHVFNEFGCSDVDSATVTVNPLPELDILPDTTICSGDSILIYAYGAAEYEWNTGDTTEAFMAAPGDTTVYYVNAASEFGCETSDSIVVNVAPGATASFSGLDLNYCANFDPDTLTGLPPGGTYYGPGIEDSVFYPEGAGPGLHTISYQITNEYGCVGEDIDTTRVISTPNIDLGTDTTELCDYDSLTLQVDTGYDSYLWHNGSTEPQITVDSTGTGYGFIDTYVIVTDSGCVTIDSMQVQIVSCPGSFIGEGYTERLEVYPNPTDKAITIQLPRLMADARLQMIDMTGRKIHNEVIKQIRSQDKFRFDMQHLEPGAYSLRLLTGDKVYQAMVILQ